MSAQPVPADSLPPRARVLLEMTAEIVDLGAGVSRLEAEFEDGRLRYVWRHEKVTASGLDRFDRPASEEDPDGGLDRTSGEHEELGVVPGDQ